MSVALTRSRLSNALRCYIEYALNRLGSAFPFLHPTPYTLHLLPLFVSVEPASICQLRCPACPVGNLNLEVSKSRNHDKFISREVWERTLAETAKNAWVIQFYFQGEPLLNKELPQMIQEAHEAGLYTIVSTNAQAMSPQMAQALVQAGLDRIIISMDGLTQETYNAYRVGGDIEKCKAALQYLRNAKEQSPIIELQCLRLRTNEQEWKQLKQQYKALGADRLVFKTAQLYDYTNGHPLMPTESKYSRYIMGKDGKYHRRSLRKGCFRVWSGVVVTTNGDVLPCCYDKAHAHAYGNIMTAPLTDLFANKKAMSFRQAAFNEQPAICKECWR